jgi:hypothetical protein
VIASFKAIVKQFAGEIQRLCTRPYLLPYMQFETLLGFSGPDVLISLHKNTLTNVQRIGPVVYASKVRQFLFCCLKGGMEK